MEIFYNNERPNYEEIVSYGPRWWTEYKEMDANYRYAGWTLDLMAYFLERTVKNQFPSQADEMTLAVFEKILKIERDPGSTVEERRRTVAAYYSGTGKLSGSVIKSIIQTYGNCDSELWWIDKLYLNIRILCSEEDFFSNRRIYQIIARRYPIHLPFTIRNMLCVFVTDETFSVSKTKYKAELTWWDNCIDGKTALDGAVMLNAEYPPFFMPRYPFSLQNTFVNLFSVITDRIFVLNEHEVKMPERWRMLFSWWDGVLDGRYGLDGETFLNVKFPSSFKGTHRIRAETGLQTLFSFVQEKFICTTDSDTNIIPMHRVLLNWWEELRTLDGTENLDGTGAIGQDTPTVWNTGKQKMSVENDEEFSVALYIPDMDKMIDGSVALNGTIKLNSGREEL